MSLFGGFMGDDDLFMGNPMHAMNMQMRSMNRLMNSLMPDPFNMLTPFDQGFQQNALMERQPVGGAGQMGLFGFPAMPNINRLLSADIGSPNGGSYCSSSVITMSSGPDGRPQVYQATTSTKTGPGGVRETRKTVQDSSRGIKKMAIGHHIGERAHIIEKEQDLSSGQLEERQEFVNLDEEEAESFDREFTSRAHMGHHRGLNRGAQPMLSIEPVDDDDDDDVVEHSNLNRRRQLPALPAPPLQSQQSHNSSATVSETDIEIPTTIDLTTNTDDTDDNSSTTPQVNNSNNTNTYTNNANYVGGPQRRVYHHRAHHLAGVAPRRPLRSPSSSPLATTPPSTAASLSVHPHPYMNSARRNYRSKHTKQHQPHGSSASSSATDATTSPKHTKK